jgi:hypothetical protein
VAKGCQTGKGQSVSVIFPSVESMYKLTLDHKLLEIEIRTYPGSGVFMGIL